MTDQADRTSTRAAAVLLTRALQRVDQVEPPRLRKPIIAMLAAGIELCAVSRSLLGKPVVHLLDLAEALVVDEECAAEESNPRPAG